MAEERAYTRVNHGTALAGNRWVERSWSAFMGTTIGLRAVQGDADWLARQTGDLCFEAGGEHYDYMALGGAEWTEEANPFAAVLTAVYAAPGGVCAMVRHCAFHDNPGLLRAVSIHNFTESPLAVHGVVLDALMLRQGPVRTHSFATEAPSAEWETGEAAAAILGVDGGLLLGIEGGGRYELFAPEADCCRLVCTEEKTLQEKEAWHLPATFVLPFTGPLDACLARGYADFRIAARRMKKWERDQAAAARETPN